MSDLAVGNPGLDQHGRRRLVVVIVYALCLQGLIFLGAGTLAWPAAWVWFGLWMVIFFGAGVYLLRHNTAIINERGRKRGETRPWDRAFALVYAPTIVLLPLVAGLDHRFEWSEMWLGWQVVGFILAIPGCLLPYWAMSVNEFLTTTVQVQGERGHYVVTVGPYRLVRHPMYLGSILAAVAEPLLLGSWWALLVGLVGSAAVLYRTAMEDRTLQSELAGYSHYAQSVRYRVLPGIW